MTVESLFGVYEQLIYELGSRDGRGVLMLGCTPETARFALPDGATAVVLRHLPADPELLRGNIGRVLSAHGHGRLQLIATGGDAAGKELLSAVKIRGLGVKLELFAIDDAGALWSGPGAKAGRDLSSALDEVVRKPGVVRLGAAEFDGWLRARAEAARDAVLKIQAYQQQLASRKPWATRALAAVIGLVFALEYLWGGPASTSTLVRMGAFVGVGPEALEWWRLISASFLHGSAMHLGGNLLVLILIGGFLERLIGWERFVVLWLVSVLGGSMAAMFFSDATVMIGASGGGWGLMCAAGVLAAMPSGLVPPLLAGPMKKSIGQVLLLNLMISFVPGVALSAHLGGGIAGGLWAAVGLATLGMRPPAHASSVVRAEPLAGPVLVAGLLSASLLLGALATGWLEDEPWVSFADGPWTSYELEVDGATLSLPAALGEPSREITDEGAIELTFGNLRTSPYEVTVEASPFQPKVLTTLRLFREFRSLKQALLEGPLRPELLRDEPSTEAEDGMEFRLDEHFAVSNGGRALRHSRVTPAGRVTVMVLEAPNTDPIAERVVEGLQLPE